MDQTLVLNLNQAAINGIRAAGANVSLFSAPNTVLAKPVAVSKHHGRGQLILRCGFVQCFFDKWKLNYVGAWTWNVTNDNLKNLKDPQNKIM